MTAIVIAFFILGFVLIGFAIYKRPDVKASFRIWSINFSLEAKNEEPKSPVLPSS